MMPKLVEALQTYSPHLPPGVVQSGRYCGQPIPHGEGRYPGEKDGGGTFYWTPQAVQFALYPSDQREDAADVDSSLLLNIRTMSNGVTLDLTFNGRVFATHRFSPDEVGKWVDWPVKVHWRQGLNVGNLMARGDQPTKVEGDSRSLLFALHEPKWTFADTPDDEYSTPTPESSAVLK